MNKFWLAFCVMVVAIAPLHADPADSEIVGTINGKTYLYEDLELKGDLLDSVKKYSEKTEVDTNLRNHAAGNFRVIALRQTIAAMSLKCDLIATQDEIAQFVSWWQSNVQDLKTKLVADRQKRFPGKEVRFGGGWNDIDEITIENEDVVEAARKEIEIWKANLCLYKTYGGGRVQQDLGTYKFLQPGEVVIAANDTLAGYPYPMIVTDGTPLNAYIAHFEKAREAGVMLIPDARYEHGFYLLLRNERLDFFDTADEEASLTTRYWTEPVFVPAPK
tara:strand:- start:30804 stop:31628 length:825 start_codon:yes stop_codon:yes gene_type:complete